MAKKILRLKEVKTRTGLGRSTIYLLIAQGSFPRSIALGERAVGWLESDLDECINERIRQSRQHGRDD